MKRYRSGTADRTHNRRRLPSQEVLNDLQELNIEGDAHMVCLGLRAEVLQQVVLHVGPGWKELALPGGDGGAASGGEDRVLHVRAGEARGGHFTDEVRVRQEVLDSGVADLVDDVDGEAPEGSLLVEFAAHVGTVGGGGGSPVEGEYAESGSFEARGESYVDEGVFAAESVEEDDGVGVGGAGFPVPVVGSNGDKTSVAVHTADVGEGEVPGVGGVQRGEGGGLVTGGGGSPGFGGGCRGGKPSAGGEKDDAGEDAKCGPRHCVESHEQTAFVMSRCAFTVIVVCRCLLILSTSHCIYQ